MVSGLDAASDCARGAVRRSATRRERDEHDRRERRSVRGRRIERCRRAIPATIVIQRVAIVSRTSRVSRRVPASSVDARAAARRPKPSGALRRDTIELVGTPGLRGPATQPHRSSRQAEAYPEAGLSRRSALARRSGSLPPLVDSGPVLMVGLTGGIGSGKSTVAGLLARAGRGRRRRRRDRPRSGRAGTRRRWRSSSSGSAPTSCAPDGSLDRAALAAKAFVTDETRKELEAITHPAIGEEFLRRIAAAPPRTRSSCTTCRCSSSRRAGYRVRRR